MPPISNLKIITSSKVAVKWITNSPEAVTDMTYSGILIKPDIQEFTECVNQVLNLVMQKFADL